MLVNLWSGRNLYVVMHRVDFRKSFDGLLGECLQLGLDPIGKRDVLLFVGRQKNRMKLLFADETGIWVSSKRFHQGSIETSFRFLEDPAVKTISEAELSIFLEGSSYRIDKKMKKW